MKIENQNEATEETPDLMLCSFVLIYCCDRLWQLTVYNPCDGGDVQETLWGNAGLRGVGMLRNRFWEVVTGSDELTRIGSSPHGIDSNATECVLKCFVCVAETMRWLVNHVILVDVSTYTISIQIILKRQFFNIKKCVIISFK